MQIAQKKGRLFWVFYRFTKLETRRKLCETICREMPMFVLVLSIILISLSLVLILIVESHKPVWAVRTVRSKRKR